MTSSPDIIQGLCPLNTKEPGYGIISNADGAHYDSVNSQGTVQSKTLQMDVKIPVQPSSFDLLQMGALLGAHELIEQTKSYFYQ